MPRLTSSALRDLAKIRAKLRRGLGALLPKHARWAIRRRLNAIFTARFHGKPGAAFQVRKFDGGAEFVVNNVSVLIPEPFSVDSTQWLLGHPEDVIELQVFLRVAKVVDGMMLDVGAHVGMFAVLFCKVCDHDVVAFDPHPAAVGRVQRLANLNGIQPNRIQVMETAIGNSIGTQNMHLDETTGFAQVQMYTYSHARSNAVVKASMTTIDKVRSTIDKVGLIKIDVEGFENEVLKGARKTLSRDRPVISLELHDDYLQERHVASRALLDALVEKGYFLMRLNGQVIEAAASFTFIPRAHLLAIPREQCENYRSIILTKP